MVSINNNVSARAGLRALQSINTQLDATQTRISTGLKINSAKDDSTIWQIASGLRSDMAAYEGSKSSLTFNKGAFDVAADGASIVADLLGQLKSALASGLNTTAATQARTDADANIAALQAQISAAISDAQFQGVNLLDGSGTMPKVTTAINAAGASTTTTVTAVNLATTLAVDNATAFGAASDFLNTTITLVAGTASAGTAAASALATAIDTVSDYAASLANASARIGKTQVLMTRMNDIKAGALSDLVDADMAEESAVLSALQVKQQLATQALSIANASSQNILRLFQ